LTLITHAAPNPWMTRAAVSIQKEVDKVQASDAPTKMEMPIRNIRLYP